MSYKDARGHTVPAGTDQASRQSLLDLSLSIPSIPAASSATAATQHVTALADAGVTISAASPVLVWRTDLQQMVSWDGSSWTNVTPGAYQAITFTGISTYGSSKYWMRKIGDIVLFSGEIKNSGGAVPAGRTTNIAIVPAGWRPSASIYGETGNCQLSATAYIAGATTPVAGGSVVEIQTSNGNIHVTASQRATVVKVTGHYLIA
ncbi:hypothetical protein [Actinomyces succiniciruminis]|uniref:Uncharacterized protein n=1 Tax=Actinomyces succiniciruminis TaxID=1522002 RepID=A0A1L7RKJ7_9ACTO|nr:hypothetical protein [Actinomyces succiniciruminis]CED90630.1 Hypothetical protein AAM4_0798 [Actinomyces succiniciruminis]